MMSMRKSPFSSLAAKDELKLEVPSMLAIESKKGMVIAKRVGKLTIEERQRKIERYRAKKNLRVWEKRINYNCRKQVADKRLRVKGRFVSKEEALAFSQHSKNDNGGKGKIQCYEDVKGEPAVRKVFNIMQYGRQKTDYKS